MVTNDGQGAAMAFVTVTLVFAESDRVWQTQLKVAQGTDIATAIKKSGFSDAFPDYPVQTPAVGIFGRRCDPAEVLEQGDRIEIYRPLRYDPMESRRRRAAHRKAAEKQKAFRPRRNRGVSKS